ncbi:MAG: hypothetical protein BWZ08_02194 [candidate division BRC1 bacterium ADurb.BinA292]|nr:MAG: hypothetical protein BWZ08_02194 [candidate division BRC1 bacterium ADurb.BinA292]
MTGDPRREGYPLYGLLAEFDAPAPLLNAVQRARAAGYAAMDAYAPFPLDGLAEALGRRRDLVPWFVLAGGVLGGVGAYAMMAYSSIIDYPLNVGGRPLHSWPSFIPITFELTVLLASLSGVAAMLLLNGLPCPHHPVFNVPEFARASRDRFFLCIESADARFDPETTRDFLATLNPLQIHAIENTEAAPREATTQ